MRIIFDATVMEQKFTGIAKSTLGLYQACLKMMQSLEIKAVHRKPLAAGLHDEMASVQIGRRVPAKLWRSVVLPVYISANRQSIVHFPWNGDVPSHVHADLVVSTIHDVLPLVIPGYFVSEQGEHDYRRLMQRSIDRSDVMLTDSDYSRKETIKNFRVPIEPVVVHVASNLGNIRHVEYQRHEDAPYFLYVGGYDKRKGLETLLKVFVDLHREGVISNRLVLVGQELFVSDAFERLRKTALDMGIVKEQGYVRDDVLAGLYSSATALVYLSKYEGFGLPPLEAMTLGCPVITTKYTSIPEVCGNAAYYVDPDDERSCARALVRLETDSELRNRLENEGRRQAAKFSWDRSAGTFLDALRNRSIGSNHLS